jgi:hypothetical protein
VIGPTWPSVPALFTRDIESAEPRDGFVDQGADVVLLADVGVEELGLRAKRAQLLDERLARLIAPTGNDDLCALIGEGDGGGAPDAGQTPVINTTGLLILGSSRTRALPPEHGPRDYKRGTGCSSGVSVAK